MGQRGEEQHHEGAGAHAGDGEMIVTSPWEREAMGCGGFGLPQGVISAKRRTGRGCCAGG